jgi:hypothetical protein
MSPETEKALERVRKLLALAGNNPNEHEAAAAAERAQAILAEHNLTIGDLRTEDVDDDFVEDNELTTSSHPWRRGLGTWVARMFFCEYLYNKTPTHHRDRHWFVGRRHNVEVAKLFFTYLHLTVNRLSHEYALDREPKLRSACRTEFRRACTSRLCMRISNRIEAAKKGNIPRADGGGNLPALLNVYETAQKQIKAHIEKSFGDAAVKEKKGRNVATKTKDYEAALAGYRAGDAIGLDAQLRTDKPSGLIGG